MTPATFGGPVIAPIISPSHIELRNGIMAFYEKEVRCQGKSILGLGPFFCSPDPASIRTFGEPLVWGSVLFEVQSMSRRCHLSLGVHGQSDPQPPVQRRSRRNAVWDLHPGPGSIVSVSFLS